MSKLFPERLVEKDQNYLRKYKQVMRAKCFHQHCKGTVSPPFLSCKIKDISRRNVSRKQDESLIKEPASLHNFFLWNKNFRSGGRPAQPEVDITKTKQPMVNCTTNQRFFSPSLLVLVDFSRESVSQRQQNYRTFWGASKQY